LVSLNARLESNEEEEEDTEASAGSFTWSGFEEGSYSRLIDTQL
jgi:hypothetical protein